MDMILAGKSCHLLLHFFSKGQSHLYHICFVVGYYLFLLGIIFAGYTLLTARFDNVIKYSWVTMHEYRVIIIKLM